MALLPHPGDLFCSSPRRSATESYPRFATAGFKFSAANHKTSSSETLEILCWLAEIITDDKSRLQCYDAAAAAQSIPKAVAPKDDPFVAAAKARVKQQLRDPASAEFKNIKVKTVGGVKGLCGELNAKNAMGGMTGYIPWAYDGKFAYVIAFNAGPGNPNALGLASVGRRNDAHDKWCK
jgi:hypothetical protein